MQFRGRHISKTLMDARILLSAAISCVRLPEAFAGISGLTRAVSRVPCGFDTSELSIDRLVAVQAVQLGVRALDRRVDGRGGVETENDVDRHIRLLGAVRIAVDGFEGMSDEDVLDSALRVVAPIGKELWGRMLSMSTEDNARGDMPRVFSPVVFRDSHTQFVSTTIPCSNSRSPRMSSKAMAQHDRPRVPYLSAAYDSSITWPFTWRNNVCGSENLPFARSPIFCVHLVCVTFYCQTYGRTVGPGRRGD